MARPVRQEEGKGNPDWTREQLLLVASREFARRGYEGASLRGIAREVGVGNPTVLHHFGSKQGLYFCALERLNISLLEVVERLEENPAASEYKRAMQVANALFDWSAHHEQIAYLIVSDLFEDPFGQETLPVYEKTAPFFARTIAFIKGGSEAKVDTTLRLMVINLLMVSSMGHAASRRSNALLGVSAHTFLEQHRSASINMMLSLLPSR